MSEQRRVREVGALEQEVPSLRERVSDFEGAMLGDLESRPVETIAVWFEQTKIAEAEERTKRARNYITFLYRVTWHVDDVHHVDEENRDRCMCDETLEHCRTFEAMDPVRGRLYKWETEEVERMKKRLTHSLPDDHPEVQRWEPWRRQRGA